MARFGADFGPILRQLDALAGTQIRRDLTAEISRVALGEVQRGFREERAPDGTAWEPSIRKKVFGGKTLRDTGALMGSFAAADTDRGFKLFVDLSRNPNAVSPHFAVVHQEGRTITAKNAPRLRFTIGPAKHPEKHIGPFFKKSVVIPARPMLPAPDELPARWDTAFTAAALRILERFTAGVR